MIKIFLTVLLFAGTALRAEGESRLLEIPEKGAAKVSQATPLWKNGEFLCLYRQEKTIACGVVTSADAQFARVVLDFSNEPLEVGDKAGKPAASKQTAGNRVAESDHVRLVDPGGARFLFKSALLWDVSQWFVSNSAEIKVSNHVSYGVKFDFFDVFRVNPKLLGRGVFLTRTFYTLPHFSGIGAQIGMGPYFFAADDGVSQANAVSAAVELSVSCRFSLFWGLTFGMQSGIRFISIPKLGAVNVGKFHPFRGAIGIDLALRF
jgi:hypothetical protein